MKRLLLIAFLFCFVGAFAQNNDTTKYYKSVDYGWQYKRLKTDSILILPNGVIINRSYKMLTPGDTASMLAAYLRKIDTTAMLSPYLRKADTATLSNRINTKVNISDTANMLSPYYLKSNPTGYITNSAIVNKVNFSDTASIVAPYLRKGDTASMLSPYYLKSNPSGYITSAAITGKVNYSDTASMLSPYAKDSFVVHKSGNETVSGSKTFNNTTTVVGNTNGTYDGLIISTPSLGASTNYGYGGIQASSSQYGITSVSDVNITTTGAFSVINLKKSGGNLATFNQSGNIIDVYGAGRVQGNLTVGGNIIKTGGTSSQFLKADGSTDSNNYLTAASIAGKMNYTDTASMLSAYYNKTAVDSKNNLKVNYTDTAAMLAGYYRSTNPNGYITASAITGKVNYTDTAAMLSAYYNKTATDSKLNLKVNISDTAAMLSPYAKTSAIPSLSGVVKYTDTASMLNNYRTQINTNTNNIATNTANISSNTANIALKVNYTDTAAMLSPYAKTANLPSLTPYVKYTDTASMLTPYSRDFNTVHKTGDETINGLKTFSNNVTVNGSASYFANADSQQLTLFGGNYSAAYVQNNIAKWTIDAQATTGILGIGRYANGSSILIDPTSLNVGIKGVPGSNYPLDVNGKGRFTDTLTANTISKIGGTSSQFLKADGSVDANTYLTSASITGKVNVSDTAAMLSPYITNATAASKYYLQTNPSGYITSSAITGKVNYTDTAAMLSPYARTANIPSLTSVVKYTDTASMLSGYYRSTNPSGYITSSAIAGKVNYTDTASMLSGYYRATNPNGYITASAISGKVNYTDTATMLSAYYNKTAANALLATKEPTISAGTTAQYWRGDKSWQTLNTTAVAEGTNLYYTDARAQSAVSGLYLPLSGGTLTGSLKVSSGGRLNIVPTSYGSNGAITFRNIADNANRWNIYNYTGGGTTYGSLNFSDGGGIDRMVINEGGNVGIGTTSPGSYRLYANGEVRFEDNIWLNSTAQSSLIYMQNGANKFNTAYNVNGWLQFYNYTAGSTSMAITNGGNVGIGTTSPIAPLHIYSSNTNMASGISTAYSNAKFRLEPYYGSSVGISMGLISPNVNYLQGGYNDGATSAPFVIQPYGGNFGVGTTSPSSSLEVAKSSGSYVPYTKINLDVSTDLFPKVYMGNGLLGGWIGYDEAGNERMVLNSYDPASHYEFLIGGSEKMRISSNGSVSLGTTSTSATSMFYAKAPASSMSWSFGPNNYNTLNIFRIEDANTTGVYLTSGNTSWTANSDERLKNINKSIDSAIYKLGTLRAVNFSWKTDSSKKENLGLIAQDVQKVFPQVIDTNAEGMLGVRYQDLIPVLVKAVQELNQKVDDKQKKIDDLESRLKAIEQKLNIQ